MKRRDSSLAPEPMASMPMTRADAEDDAEGGEQGAGLLCAQIGDGLAEVGELAGIG